MKKIAVILFSSFYLLTSVGVAIMIHYCEGNVENVGFFVSKGDCCCGEEVDTHDCCNFENYFLQLDEEQQISSTLRVLLPQSLAIASTQNNIFNEKEEQTETLFPETALPPLPKQQLWLLNCTLTYYG